MKLLFCRWCCDVVKLRTVEWRTCECGRVRGRYREDGWHADVSAEAEVIGLGNGSLVRALHRGRDSAPADRELVCWVMGADAPRVHWQNEAETRIG